MVQEGRYERYAPGKVGNIGSDKDPGSLFAGVLLEAVLLDEGLDRLDCLHRIGGERVFVDEGVMFALQQQQIHDPTSAPVLGGQLLGLVDCSPLGC